MRAIIIVIIFLSCGCDRFYFIPINGEAEPLKIEFDCGIANIKMINWQGRAYDFYQEFDLNQPIILYADSIHAYFKNVKYNVFFPTLDYQNVSSVKIEGRQKLRIAFHIDEKVNKGDTIIVVPTGYLYCNDKKVNIYSLFLIPTENLRGPFESRK